MSGSRKKIMTTSFLKKWWIHIGRYRSWVCIFGKILIASSCCLLRFCFFSSFISVFKHHKWILAVTTKSFYLFSLLGAQSIADSMRNSFRSGFEFAFLSSSENENPSWTSLNLLRFSRFLRNFWVWLFPKKSGGDKERIQEGSTWILRFQRGKRTRTWTHLQS